MFRYFGNVIFIVSDSTKFMSENAHPVMFSGDSELPNFDRSKVDKTVPLNASLPISQIELGNSKLDNFVQPEKQ